MPMGLDEVLQEIAQGIHPYLAKGKVASYIPALRRVPLTKFGMAVCMVDGAEFAIRDAAEQFSIQSISKLFTLMLAMSRIGDEVWRHVGKEPSGTVTRHVPGPIFTPPSPILIGSPSSLIASMNQTPVVPCSVIQQPLG